MKKVEPISSPFFPREELARRLLKQWLSTVYHFKLLCYILHILWF